MPNVGGPSLTNGPKALGTSGVVEGAPALSVNTRRVEDDDVEKSRY